MCTIRPGEHKIYDMKTLRVECDSSSVCGEGAFLFGLKPVNAFYKILYGLL